MAMRAAAAQVLELAEPVEDEQGYVYEKFAILQHITRSARYPGGAVPCPMAGAYAGLPTYEKCFAPVHRRKGLGMLCNTPVAPSLGLS